MSFRKEVLTLPKDFKIDLFYSAGMKDIDPTLHFHDCLEINFIVEGTGTNFIEDKVYELSPGDFYVINNLEHHRSESHGDLNMLVIVFDPIFSNENQLLDYDYLKPFFNRNVYFSNRITEKDVSYNELKNTLIKIVKEWEGKEEGYQVAIKALLMYFLVILFRNYKLKGELADNVKKFKKSYDRIRTSINYISEHYQEEISLERLAQISFMNKTYFSSYFKEVMKVTVTEYLDSLRISTACRLLKTTNKSMTDIASEAGFNSVSYFNKSFKKITKITPSLYKQQK